jgi:23S rRNA pseudouridine2605 synthase
MSESQSPNDSLEGNSLLEDVEELSRDELGDDEMDAESADADFDVVDETADNTDFEADGEFAVRERDGETTDGAKPGRQPKFAAPTAATFEPQRLAKILAAAGIDARRKCEDYVTSGRVTVDGKTITDLAFRADPFTQKVALDGERVRLQRKVYFALNKPTGVLCTNHDPAGRPRVMDLFPQFKERLFAIGRLDEESEGLLLVTNDGELANRLAHPRYRIPKFYLCHVKGVPTAETLASLKRGMYFEEGRFSVEGVRLKKAAGDSAYLDIILNEGQNREIRRLMARVGHKVMKLKRIGFGPIRLSSLPRGAFRQLSVDEIRLLKQLCEQRAYLDSTASRGRKPRSKKFGGGSKPSFQKRPAQGTVHPPRGRFVDESAGAFDDGSELNSQRRYGGPPRQGGANRRPQGNVARPQRRRFNNDEGGESFDSNIQSGGRRRYGGPPRQEGANRWPQSGARHPQRGQFTNQSESFESNTQSGSQRRYDRPSRQGGASRRTRTGVNRPQRRQFNDEGGESFDSNTQSGGQRRYGGPPRQGDANLRTQGGANRPQRRFLVSDDAGTRSTNQGLQGKGNFSGGQRRHGGNRPGGQQRFPQRGERRPPQIQITADGKEILEGNVTGFRSVPKEGRARRPMTGQRTFNARQKRIQRRRKAEE